MGNQIRLHKGSEELLFFLEAIDPSHIHNRILKFNISFKTNDVVAFISNNFKNPTSILTPHKGFQYHGEIKEADLDGTLSTLVATPPPGFTMFQKNSSLDIPSDYEFHEVGVAVNDVLNKGKYGNIEIKFRPKNAVILLGINPDPLIVVNIHLISAQYNHTNQIVLNKWNVPSLTKLINPFLSNQALSVLTTSDDNIKTAINHHQYQAHPKSQNNLQGHLQALNSKSLAIHTI